MPGMFNFLRVASPPLILPLMRLNCSSQCSFHQLLLGGASVSSTLLFSELFSFNTSDGSKFFILSGCPMTVNSVPVTRVKIFLLEIDVTMNLRSQRNQSVVLDTSNIYDWLTAATSIGSCPGFVGIIDWIMNTQDLSRRFFSIIHFFFSFLVT